VDDNYHGTFITGIIKALAPNAKIIHMKACDLNGDCYASAIINSIDYCMVNRSAYNMNIISISIGDEDSHPDENCFPTDSLSMAINDAYDQGVFVSVASGNDGFTDGISYPACARGATSVGATTKSDSVASFSNTFTTLDLLSPGALINSTGLNDAYGLSSGTSFSCPMVSAAAALLQQYGNDSFSPACIETKLKNGGVPINTTGRGGIWPRIDVESSLDLGCECTVDADCGTSGYVGGAYCSFNNLRRDIINYTCTAGVCSNLTDDVLYQSCPNGCVVNTTTCRASGSGSGGGGANLKSCEVLTNTQWQAGSPTTVTVRVFDSYGGLFGDLGEVAISVYDPTKKVVYRSTLPNRNPSVGVYEFDYSPDADYSGAFNVECYARRFSTEVVNYKPVDIMEIGGLKTLSGNAVNDGALGRVDSIVFSIRNIATDIWTQLQNVAKAIWDLF
jgi:hypothetical protein